jgi:hypothetical protein
MLKTAEIECEMINENHFMMYMIKEEELFKCDGISFEYNIEQRLSFTEMIQLNVVIGVHCSA